MDPIVGQLRYRPRESPAVDAVQLTDDANWTAIAAWCGSGRHWATHPHQAGDARDQMFVPTVWGINWANVGDWIVKTRNGAFEVLKPTEFEERYELDE